MEPEPRPATTVAGFLAARRAGLGATLVTLAAVAAGWFAWTRVEDDVRSSPGSVLFPEAIAVRGVADWVKGDLKAEALRNASLDGGLPLDDPRLADRLRRAFEMHPWVREVTSVVLRQPAAADVALRCREPVAMVGVKGGLLAVDAEGVVLPSGDFTAESAAAYPRLAGVLTTPLGLEGTAWGDPVVEEGAAIAAAIGPEWPALGLRDLKAIGGRRGRTWEFAGDDGRTVVFGSAPGREFEGEPPVAVKIARLKELAASAAPGRFDLTAEPAAATAQPAPISP